MGEVTRILDRVRQGDPGAAAELLLIRFVAFVAFCVTAWTAVAAEEFEGRFLRLCWYERETAFNPHYERRFRVNAPEAVLHPEFGPRIESRENGLMIIRAEENLRHLSGAELYLEVWGGHPGTSDKRVTVNGRSQYRIPEVGTVRKNCVYHYPVIRLGMTDLVNGYNAFQFACDQGTSFWGHFLIDNACLRLVLTENHPELAQARLHAFSATVKARINDAKETMDLTLVSPTTSVGQISSVDYEGYYDSYDENGNLETLDWHGFTKNRKPVGIIGTTTAPPFSYSWDLSMIPNQGNMSVRATIHFQGHSNLVYVTAAERNLPGPRRRANVTIHSSKDLPMPFWSRANKKQSCTIKLDTELAQIERAELYVTTWTGGAGAVKHYFTLNGTFFPVAEGNRHEVQFSRLNVDPKILKKGTNQVELVSDTPHHGIEVFWPGPALVVRSPGADKQRGTPESRPR